MKCIAFSLLLSLLLLQTAIAQQKSISLRPLLAVHHHYSYEDKKLSESHPSFNEGLQDLLLDLRVGLLIDYQYHAKWAISTGIMGTGVGLGSRLNGSGGVLASISSLQVVDYTQIPIIITHYGKPFQKFRNQEGPLLLGRLIYSLGANLNLSKGNDLNNNLAEYDEPSFTFIETGNHYYRKFNIGLQAGLGLQFHRSDGHNNMRLELVYHKGLLKQAQYNVTYRTANMQTAQHGVVSGRGSWIGLRLSYPIRIFSR